jgi:hypothetical protein
MGGGGRGTQEGRELGLGELGQSERGALWGQRGESGSGYGSCAGMRTRSTIGRGQKRGEEGRGSIEFLERDQLRPAMDRRPVALLDVASSLNLDLDLALASNVEVDSKVAEQDERWGEDVDLLGMYSPEESEGRSRGIDDLEGLDLDLDRLGIDAPTEEQHGELSTGQAAGSLDDDDMGHGEGGKEAVGTRLKENGEGCQPEDAGADVGQEDGEDGVVVFKRRGQDGAKIRDARDEDDDDDEEEDE